MRKGRVIGAVCALAWLSHADTAIAAPILDPGAPNGLVLYNLGSVALPQNVNPAFLTYGGISFNGGALLLSASDPTLGGMAQVTQVTEVQQNILADAFAYVPSDGALSAGIVVGDTGISGEGGANVLQIYGLDANGNPAGPLAHRPADGDGSIFTPSDVPEPSSIVLAGLGLLVSALLRAALPHIP